MAFDGWFYPHHLADSYSGRLGHFSPLERQVTLGSANKRCRLCRRPGWGIGCGERGYKYFLSGYVLLECNLTGLVCCGHISGGRGGGYKYFLSGYVLLECNLTGLFIISFSDILGILVRLCVA